jgi:hypothetical protein
MSRSLSAPQSTAVVIADSLLCDESEIRKPARGQGPTNGEATLEADTVACFANEADDDESMQNCEFRRAA